LGSGISKSLQYHCGVFDCRVSLQPIRFFQLDAKAADVDSAVVAAGPFDAVR
jgi:hypothetical protein